MAILPIGDLDERCLPTVLFALGDDRRDGSEREEEGGVMSSQLHAELLNEHSLTYQGEPPLIPPRRHVNQEEPMTQHSLAVMPFQLIHRVLKTLSVKSRPNRSKYSNTANPS